MTADAMQERYVQMPAELSEATKDLVAHFAEAMAAKLRAAEQKYGYSTGWKDGDWMEECREKLKHHIRKGDPRDVAAYCAFLWFHGAPTYEPSDRDEVADAALRRRAEQAEAQVAELEKFVRAVCAADTVHHSNEAFGKTVTKIVAEYRSRRPDAALEEGGK